MIIVSKQCNEPDKIELLRYSFSLEKKKGRQNYNFSEVHTYIIFQKGTQVATKVFHPPLEGDNSYFRTEERDIKQHSGQVVGHSNKRVSEKVRKTIAKRIKTVWDYIMRILRLEIQLRNRRSRFPRCFLLLMALRLQNAVICIQMVGRL